MPSTKFPRSQLGHGPTAAEGAAGTPCPLHPDTQLCARSPSRQGSARSHRPHHWSCSPLSAAGAGSASLAGSQGSCLHPAFISPPGTAPATLALPRHSHRHRAGRCCLAQALGWGAGTPEHPPPGPECLAAVPMSHLIRLGSSPGTEDVRRKQEAARGPEEGVGGRAPGLTLRHHHHRCPPCVHCPRGHAPADGCHQAPRTSPGSAKLLKAFFCSWWMPPVLLAP